MLGWGNPRPGCFASHTFTLLDWFSLITSCFCDFKTQKIKEQMLPIGRGRRWVFRGSGTQHKGTHEAKYFEVYPGALSHTREPSLWK